MKLKLILFCSAFLILSCGSLDGERDPIGFNFKIANDSGVEINNAKITIGGLKNGEFVGTESYLLPKIRIRKSNTETQFIAINDNRWKPNLNLIMAISDKAYFTVQLEGKKEVLLYNAYESNKLVSAEIAKNGIIISNYGGVLSIGITKDSINALFFENNY